MGTILFILFTIFVVFLLALFVSYARKYTKHHDTDGKTICTCGRHTPLYTDSIWGRTYKCIDCQLEEIEIEDEINDIFGNPYE